MTWDPAIPQETARGRQGCGHVEEGPGRVIQTFFLLCVRRSLCPKTWLLLGTGATAEHGLLGHKAACVLLGAHSLPPPVASWWFSPVYTDTLFVP